VRRRWSSKVNDQRAGPFVARLVLMFSLICSGGCKTPHGDEKMECNAGSSWSLRQYKQQEGVSVEGPISVAELDKHLEPGWKRRFGDFRRNDQVYLIDQGTYGAYYRFRKECALGNGIIAWER